MENIKNTYQTDVLVIGGSLEGCITALEAAAAGHKVLVAESSGSLGGAATNGMYVYLPMAEITGAKERQYADMLMADAGYPCTRNRVLYYDQSLKVVLKRALDRAGVSVLTHLYPVQALIEEQGLKGFRFACKTGAMDILAEKIVDATDKMEGAGAALLEAREKEKAVRLSVRCNQVDTGAIRRAAEEVREGEGWLVGRLSCLLPYEKTEIMPMYSIDNQNGISLSAADVTVFHNQDCRELILCGLTARLDAVNLFTLSKAQTALRRFAYEIRDHLRKAQPGFEKMNMIQAAPQLDCYGIRTYPENPYDNLYLLNNERKKYDNIQAISIGVSCMH